MGGSAAAHLRRQANVNRVVIYDTETTGLDRHAGAEMFAFSTSDWDGNEEVYRLDRAGARGAKARERLNDLWGDEGMRTLTKTCHNARFDIGMTQKRLGRSLRGHSIHETMALSHLDCNVRRSHALQYLGWELFKYPRGYDNIVHRYINSERGLQDAPEEELDPYERADARRTLLCLRFLLPRVRADGMSECYENERKLVWTALDIEDRGVMIDRRATERLRRECEEKANQAREDVWAVAGEQINPNPNSGQVKFLLYQTLGLPVLKRTAKRSAPSVDADTLKALQEQTGHPVLDALLRYSAYSRGAGSLQGNLDLADDLGVLHPKLNPYGARSSRTSSANPNAQNISKSTTLKVRYPIPERQTFRPRPGFVNFSVDYSGIQARQLVDASGDARMLKIFLEGDGDVHSVAAGIFYGERFRLAPSGSKARKGMRDAAKNAVYAVGFGAGLRKVAACLGLPEAEAAPGFAEFCRTFPDYAGFNRRLITQVRRDGFIRTAFNRKLYVSRAKPYVGANYRIQGDEAGVVKRAAVRVDDYLLRETGGEAGIVLLIHDEIVFEWPRAQLGEARGCLRDMRELMIDFPEFKVPLEVDVKIWTTTWEDAKSYDIAA